MLRIISKNGKESAVVVCAMRDSEGGLMRPVTMSYRVLYALLFACVLVLLVVLLPRRRLACHSAPPQAPLFALQEAGTMPYTYNATYPLTSPRSKLYM